MTYHVQHQGNVVSGGSHDGGDIYRGREIWWIEEEGVGVLMLRWMSMSMWLWLWLSWLLVYDVPLLET